jgi:hypothetical protein
VRFAFKSGPAGLEKASRIAKIVWPEATELLSATCLCLVFGRVHVQEYQGSFNFDPRYRRRGARCFTQFEKNQAFQQAVKANEASFLAAVEIAGISSRLLASLETNAPPKNRDEEAAKAKARAAERFGT